MKIASDVAASNLPAPVQAAANQQTTNAKPADQPGDQSFTLWTTKGIDDSFTNLDEGWNRVAHPDSWGGFVHGTVQLTSALPQLIGTYEFGQLQAGAQWVNNKVAGIPVVQNVVQPIGDAVSGFGGAVGSLFDGGGQSANDIGAAFEDLSHGDGKKALCHLGDAVKDLGGGVASAVSGVVNSVGDSVAHFFHGW